MKVRTPRRPGTMRDGYEVEKIEVACGPARYAGSPAEPDVSGPAKRKR